VRGWFSVDEAEALAHLAAGVPALQAIVELGSFCGRSAIALATPADGQSNRAGRSVNLVDPNGGLEGYGADDSHERLKENLRRRDLLHLVSIRRMTAIEAADTWDDGPVGLLFIDARHDEPSVRNDLEAWRPHLAPGALVVYHDANQPGPSTVAREELTANDRTTVVGFRDSLLITRMSVGRQTRGKDNAPWVRLLQRLDESYVRWLKVDKDRVVHQLECQISALTEDDGR